MLKFVAVGGDDWEEKTLAGCISWMPQLWISRRPSRSPGLHSRLNTADKWDRQVNPKRLYKLYKLGMIVAASLQAAQLSDLQLIVGAAVGVSCLRSDLGLGVTAGRFFILASLSLSFGLLGLSEDREMKGKEEERIIIIIWLTGINSCDPSAPGRGSNPLAAETQETSLFISINFDWFSVWKLEKNVLIILLINNNKQTNGSFWGKNLESAKKRPQFSTGVCHGYIQVVYVVVNK